MDCVCEKAYETPNLRDHQIMRKIKGIRHYWMAGGRGGYLKVPKWLIWNSLINQIWGYAILFFGGTKPFRFKKTIENPEIN